MTIDDKIKHVTNLLQGVKSYSQLIIADNFEIATIADMKDNAKDLFDTAKSVIDTIKDEIDEWE